ncbi:hypothetical protein JAAARDRAFT_136452 [Jaapia argillacea MUCL 33604]|uniref:RING-type domain-containing protein n=1 Tax=Jaapia argillacea MUCL 33604 TaxID=933084 RepID=A0A067PJA5_9AGAM|nr:hypothetical protein JAAARDRAFT_136452 [Jaapia argillacea MUCL 33604]
MLIIHPSSTCDVCLEGYNSVNCVPHAVACGHIFCLRCLQSLTKLSCPLCRVKFEIPEVRRLHLDPAIPLSPRTAVADLAKASPEVRRMQDAITRIVREGASLSDVKTTIDDIHLWLKGQPQDQVRSR